MYDVPVLILIYNRPKFTKKLIMALKIIKPKKIYISCDGPKKNREDIEKNKKTKDCLNLIDWKCDIKKNFFIENKGCKEGISNGINWFFNFEREGIILEDDCIPTRYFFHFCKKMLKKYKNNTKVHCIGGVNFLRKNDLSKSYYFSKYNHCWGWATWRKSWKFNDPYIKFWPNFKKSNKWKNFHRNKIEKRYWTKIFDNTFNNKIDSWAYPWTLSLWKINGLTVTPTINLVKNIGLGKNSTHSFFREEQYSVKVINKFDIIHPKKILVNDTADKYVFKNHFKGVNYLYPWRLIYLLKIFFTNPFIFLKKMIKIIS